jgi:hypothetical protein
LRFILVLFRLTLIPQLDTLNILRSRMNASIGASYLVHPLDERLVGGSLAGRSSRGSVVRPASGPPTDGQLRF